MEPTKGWVDMKTIEHKVNNNQPKHAYGTFLFRDSGYLPGILMVAYKLSKLSPGIQLICLCTDDIDEGSLSLIRKFYDRVINIDGLKIGRNRVGRQQPLPYMFTRFRFLDLKGLDKILILDSDMLPLKDLRGLFQLNAPAGVLNESKEIIKADQAEEDVVINKWSWHEKYDSVCPHGSLIPKIITNRPMKDPKGNMGINGGLMLFKPSKSDFSRFINWCHEPSNSKIIESMEWPDMQTITAFYSGKWTNIDAHYLGLYGFPNVKSLKGIHFIGPKPWQWRLKGFEYRLNNFPDYKLWAEEYLNMCQGRPEVLNLKKMRDLKYRIIEGLQKG